MRVFGTARTIAKKVIARLREHGCYHSIGTTMHPVVRAAIEQIADERWESVVDYPGLVPAISAALLRAVQADARRGASRPARLLTP